MFWDGFTVCPTMPQKILPAESSFYTKNDLWPKTQNTVKNMFWLSHQKLVFFTRFNLYTGCPVKLFTPAFKSKFCQMQKMVLHLKIDLEIAEKFDL